MLSSRKIFKSEQIFNDEQSSFIDTNVNLVRALVQDSSAKKWESSLEEETTPVDEESWESLSPKKASFLKNAQNEANQIRAEADRILNEAELVKKDISEIKKETEVLKIEAGKAKEKALKSGYQEGEKAGYEAGYQSGYEEALSIGSKESARLKDEALKVLNEAQKYASDYYEDKKNELLDLSVGMAEEIVHTTIESSPDKLLELVKPVIHRLKKEDHFITLIVGPEQRSFVESRLQELGKIHPGVRFAVLTDNTLEKNGCIVDGAHALVDLQVRKQLDIMLNEMKSWE